MLHFDWNGPEAMPWDQNIVQDRTFKFVVLRDQLPPCRASCNLEKHRRHHISR
jgi:hypothetical protein